VERRLDPDPLLGRLIANKMELLELLGEGAMGRVYRARHLALDKIVAIKLLHRTETQSSNLALRFQAEARAASRLDHPNSLRILDFGEDEKDGLLYLAMEYIQGEDLQSVLQRQPLLDPIRIADIMAQVLAALSVAHQQGVVHRDLKPGNVMLIQRLADDEGKQDLVKVCDFGLAKLLEGGLFDEKGAPLTKQGSIMGTPLYMSPEQASGDVVDGASDVYSCGVMLYQMLAGRPPFEAESAAGLLIKHITEEPRPIREVRPEADPRLAAIAESALAKQKEDRPSARDMMLALRGVLREADGAQTRGARLSSSAGRSTSVPEAARRGAGTDRTHPEAVAQEISAPRKTMSQSSAPAAQPGSGSLPAVIMGSIALVLAAGVAVFAFVTRPKDSPIPRPPVIAAEPPAQPQVAPAPAPIVEAPVQEASAVRNAPEVATHEIERTREPKKKKREHARPPQAVPHEAPPPVAESKPEATPTPPEANPVPEPPVAPPPAPKVEPPKPEPEGPKKLTDAFTVETSIVKLVVTGGISTNQSAAALQRALPALTKCLKHAAARDGVETQGSLSIRARIDLAGQLRGISVSGGLGGTEECASEALSNVRMPRPDTGDGTAQFTVAYRTRM
jgi:serine/threonine-protein kinase